MPTIKRVLPFIVVLSILLGSCSSNTSSQPFSTKTTWVQSSSTPTIPAIPTYISPTAPNFETKPISIPPVIFPDWDGKVIEVICLSESVELKGNLKERPASLNLMEAISNTVQHMGITVADTGTSCDASLTMDLSATSIGASYGTGNHCYTGARIDINLTLTDVSYPEKNLLFENEIKPPSMIVGSCNDDPQQAPFESLWRDGLLRTLTEIWGETVYWAALSVNPSTDLLPAATKELPSLSPGEDGIYRILSTIVAAPNGELDYVTAIELIKLWNMEQSVPYLVTNLYDTSLPWHFRLKAAEGLYDLNSLSSSEFSVLIDLFDTYPIGMAYENVPRVAPVTNETDLFSLVSMIAATQPADLLAIFMPGWLDKEESLQLQTGAAWILSNIGEAGYPVIIPFLGNASGGSLPEFIESLLNSKGQEIVPYLFQYLNTSARYSGKAAAFRILASVTGKDFGEDLEKWQSWWENQ